MNAHKTPERTNSQKLPPLHLVTPVWGDDYVRTFIEITLPNFASPGNLPAIKPFLRDGVYRIYTYPEFFERIRESAACRRVAECVRVDLLPITQDDANKHLQMTWCYNQAVRLADEADAITVFLNADMIYSDGTFRNAVKILQSGKRVIEIEGFRTLKPQMEMALRDYIDPATGALILPPRDMVRMTMEYIHPISKMHFWEEPCEGGYMPYHTYWRAGDALVAKATHLYPLATYPTSKGVQTDVTIDADFLEKAAPNIEDTYVVCDSDEIFSCELSDPSYLFPGTYRRATISNMRYFLFQTGACKPRHMALARNTIVMHAGEPDTPQIRAAKTKAERWLQDILTDPEKERLTPFDPARLPRPSLVDRMLGRKPEPEDPDRLFYQRTRRDLALYRQAVPVLRGAYQAAFDACVAALTEPDEVFWSTLTTLDQVYEQELHAAPLPPAAELDVDLSRSFLGVGWGPPDEVNNRAMRYLGPDEAATFFAALTPADYKVLVRVELATHDQCQAFRARINDGPAFKPTVGEDAGRYVLLFDVPRAALESNRQRVKIHLQCVEGGKPADLLPNFRPIGSALSLSQVRISATEAPTKPLSAPQPVAAAPQTAGPALEASAVNGAECPSPPMVAAIAQRFGVGGGQFPNSVVPPSVLMDCGDARLPGRVGTVENRRRVRLVIPCWRHPAMGEFYIDLFCELGLPTLLARHNLPYLAAHHDVDVAICCAYDDIPSFEARLEITALKAIAPVKYIDINEYYGNIPREYYGVTLSYAYWEAIRDLGEQAPHTHFIFWNADFICSNGAMVRLAELISDDVAVVTAPSLRIDSYTTRDRLAAQRHINEETGAPVLPLGPREMVGMFMANPHPTVLAKSLNCYPRLYIEGCNQYYWWFDGFVLGRFFLAFPLCIRPQRMPDGIDGYVDYSFIPDMAPDGTHYTVSDSDEMCILEIQDPNREWDLIRISRISKESMAGYYGGLLNGWTTAGHREQACAHLVFKAKKPGPALSAAKAETDRFMNGVFAAMTGAPKWHNGHPFWVDAMKVIAAQAPVARNWRSSAPRSRLAERWRDSGVDLDLYLGLAALSPPLAQALAAAPDPDVIVPEGRENWFNDLDRLCLVTLPEAPVAEELAMPRVIDATQPFPGLRWGHASRVNKRWGRAPGPYAISTLLLRVADGRAHWLRAHWLGITRREVAEIAVMIGDVRLPVELGFEAGAVVQSVAIPGGMAKAAGWVVLEFHVPERLRHEAAVATFTVEEMAMPAGADPGALFVWTDAFDEHAYLAAHPDVLAAIQSGDFASGLDHYRKHGQAEGRPARWCRTVELADSEAVEMPALELAAGRR